MTTALRLWKTIPNWDLTYLKSMVTYSKLHSFVDCFSWETIGRPNQHCNAPDWAHGTQFGSPNPVKISGHYYNYTATVLQAVNQHMWWSHYQLESDGMAVCCGAFQPLLDSYMSGKPGVNGKSQRSLSCLKILWSFRDWSFWIHFLVSLEKCTHKNLNLKCQMRLQR